MENERVTLYKSLLIKSQNSFVICTMSQSMLIHCHAAVLLNFVGWSGSVLQTALKKWLNALRLHTFFFKFLPFNYYDKIKNTKTKKKTRKTQTAGLAAMRSVLSSNNAKYSNPINSNFIQMQSCGTSGLRPGTKCTNAWIKNKCDNEWDWFII